MSSKTRTPRITIRLSEEEKAILEKAADGMTLSAYIRTRIFYGELKPVHTRRVQPIKDQQTIAQLLGILGQSRIANNLNQLAKAVNTGSLPLTPDVEQDICEARKHIAANAAHADPCSWPSRSEPLMILKGNQRAGSNQLAIHLLNVDDNEHVEVHELRGFISDDLKSAFHEIYAVSKGTKCQQFMFSLSLSPPQNENVPAEVFKNAINQIEKKLGLEDQARAIVFHEKEGRRHAHVVWSRIKVDEMKAINLPHYKLKLRDISRNLYLEHGWKMPQGLVNSKLRDPTNFNLTEWQQAKRTGKNAKALKQAFQDCWAISDSRAAFAHALKECGLYLAKGDRRGFVAVDYQGEVYAIARWAGVKTKNVKTKLGSPKDLQSVDGTKAYIAEKMTGMLERHVDEKITKFSKAGEALDVQRNAMVKRQRIERVLLLKKQQTRQTTENKHRFARLPRGLSV